MNCDQAMQLMSAGLDGELAPEEQTALQAHLARCEECRRLYEVMASVDDKVHALAEPAPAGLKQGILYRIGQESGQTKAPRRRFFGVGTGFGLAAAVLVLLVGTHVIQLPQPKVVRDTAPEQTSAEAPAETQILQVGQADTDAFLNLGDVDFTAEDRSEETSVPSGSSTVALNGSLAVDKNAPTKPDADSEENLPATDPAAPAETQAAAPAEPLRKRPVGVQARVACQSLSSRLNAPLLLYSEFNDESLFALLREQAPALWQELEPFLPETAPEADPETGLIVYEADCGTVLAVQEWLAKHVSAQAEPEDRPAALRLTEQLEELDPGSGSLCRIITWEDGTDPVRWPEIWPEDWESRFLARDNWALFLPAEDALPKAEAPACLVFQA